MKTSHKKALLIIAIILLVSIANFFFPSIFSDNKHLILIGVVFGLTHYLLGLDFARKSSNRRIIRNILIYILIYYLLIYLLGLITGFVRTIYGFNLTNLIYNIIPSLLAIVGVEIVRYTLVQKTSKDKMIMILSCLAFIVFEVSISFNYYNFSYKDEIYQFIALLVLVSITKNILMTIIDTKTDYIPAIVYRILMETLLFILIIQPNLGPYLNSVALIIVPGLIGIMVANINKTTKDSPEKTKKNNPVYFVAIGILLILVVLNSGLIKYQTLVIGSNSMKDFMEKGDVVLITHLKGDERYNVKKGEILVYRYDGKIVCHRVTKRLNRGNAIYYKTKGDNNDQEDKVIISKDQVMGKIILRVKYIGLPSVWLSELF